jgi:octaprenyl-diphosphate synthase
MTRVNLKELIRPVSKDLETFDKKQDEYLVADSTLINTVVKHIMTSRGKRLRPALLFLSSRSGGVYTQKLVDAALSIELIHTATLLHDDVIDESKIRRGQETVNYRWGNLVSVLMGDYLFSKASRVMVSTGSRKLINSISVATERVSFGELRQIEEMSNYGLDEKEYIKIISDKTASLFAVACEAGPILKKSSYQKRRRFRDFGENIGIAFQIADDLLDYIGDSEKTGKRLGSDLIQGKVTLPLIYSLSKSSRKARLEIVDLLNNGANKQGVSRVIKFITEQGGIDYAYSIARSYSNRAADIFGILNDSVYSRTLRELLGFTVSRDN